MIDSDNKLNKRFTRRVLRKWKQNERRFIEKPCVYVFIAFDICPTTFHIAYVGSTTNLYSRYKSHQITKKLYEDGLMWSMYFKEMDEGYYDYEKKLIKKLQPFYNKQHK